MDTMKVGKYIQSLRKAAGYTQKELAEKLSVSFQAVSKWEQGKTLPDTIMLLDLCDLLGTTVDKLLNGGVFVLKSGKLMKVEDVIAGFKYIDYIKKCFGENCTFYTGMVEGINNKMNIDLIEDMKNQSILEVLWAEVLIQGILSGRVVDMDEVKALFTREDMIKTIEKYINKASK